MSAGAPAANRACFTLAEIVAACGGTLLNQTHDAGSLSVAGVTTDSRAVAPGQLFLALRGEKFDGHDYLVPAQAAGASALVVERAWLEHHQTNLTLPLVAVDDTLLALGAIAAAHRKRFDLQVVGVTGSYGKTTTRSLIAATLGAKFTVLSSAGNYNNEIGVPQTLLQLGPEHEAAVIEMGMRGPGQIAYLAGLAAPTVGVVTNIGPQHIELLGSVENIAAAKAELLEALPPDGLAMLPADDSSYEYLRGVSPCRVVSFGRAAEADFRVSEISAGPDGNISFVVNRRSAGSQQPTTQCGVHGDGHSAQPGSPISIGYSTPPTPGLCVPVALPLPGAHNAINAAVAIAVAVELGVPLGDAARALETAVVPGARMRIVRAKNWTIIDDCYNAGPNSMRAALETLRDFPGAGRRVAILGSMKELGDHAQEEHRKIGEFAATVAALIVAVGEEARFILEAVAGQVALENPASQTAPEDNVPPAEAVGWPEAPEVRFQSLSPSGECDASTTLEPSIAGIETHWFPAAAAAAAVPGMLQSGDVVLVKGSRSVGLELVVSAIAG